MRSGCAVIALALLAACERGELDALDEAAEAVAAEQRELARAERDLRGGEATIAERADVAHASAELARAEIDYEEERKQVLERLRFRLHLYATQTAVARGILADPGLVQSDRQEATDRVLTLERELGEAQLAIDALATSTAAQWEDTQTTVNNAFQQLEGAHEEAFEVLLGDRALVRARPGRR